jgi:uncharacterized protein (DUF1778 family)
MDTLEINTFRSKKARIEIKTTPDVKTELEMAASESGVTLTAFILNHATEHAKRILAQKKAVYLDSIAWGALNEAINNPAPATDSLRDLMKLR